jgi:hypothetical protein
VCGCTLRTLEAFLGAARNRLAALALASAVTLAAAPLAATGDAAPKAGIVERLVPEAAAPLFTRASLPAFRAHFGRADLYVPAFFHLVDGKYDLIVHFHGMSSVQEGNIEKAHLNAAVVSVNLGFGSGPYEDAYRDPAAFARLVAVSQWAMGKSGRADGARLGRLALSSWSAGYGAVAAILRQPANANRLDALFMAEGPHSNYADKAGHVDDAPLAKYLRFVKAAQAGDKLFVMTHSAIHTDDYPSTTESIGELLALASVEKVPNDTVGPRGMQQIYQGDSGDFHVKGYEGAAVKDHVDHIRAMDVTMYPYLKRRWGL